eukprot:scaffold74293_cov18-Tisochrysis_lutea.AAC.1
MVRCVPAPLHSVSLSGYGWVFASRHQSGPCILSSRCAFLGAGGLARLGAELPQYTRAQNTRIRTHNTHTHARAHTQESTRHTEAMEAITTYLGYGSYEQWDEEQRINWLVSELQRRGGRKKVDVVRVGPPPPHPLRCYLGPQAPVTDAFQEGDLCLVVRRVAAFPHEPANMLLETVGMSVADASLGRRPLIPPDMPMTDDVREVLDTCRTVARLGAGCLGAYVISMAKRASDVLAVELLQREANFQVCVCMSRMYKVGQGCYSGSTQLVLVEAIKASQMRASWGGSQLGTKASPTVCPYCGPWQALG